MCWKHWLPFTVFALIRITVKTARFAVFVIKNLASGKSCRDSRKDSGVLDFQRAYPKQIFKNEKMERTQYARQIDSVGRVLIPAKLRESLNIETG